MAEKDENNNISVQDQQIQKEQQVAKKAGQKLKDGARRITKLVAKAAKDLIKAIWNLIPLHWTIYIIVIVLSIILIVAFANYLINNNPQKASDDMTIARPLIESSGASSGGSNGKWIDSAEKCWKQVCEKRICL